MFHADRVMSLNEPVLKKLLWGFGDCRTNVVLMTAIKFSDTFEWDSFACKKHLKI